ncbi:MAG: hypothetical protein JXA57_17990 [Armatimonadetes bacterium]|nr:hypothetical protein [Armatimonadota bacterium]
MIAPSDASRMDLAALLAAAKPNLPQSTPRLLAWCEKSLGLAPGIVAILQKADVDGVAVQDGYRSHSVCEQTF